jgi:uncharacterized membrane protein
MKKRLYSLDIFRGLAIMMVIIFHRFMYDWPGVNFFFEEDTGFLMMPWLTAIMFFAGMGGIFSMISGVVTSYSTYNRVSSGKGNKKMIFYAALFSFLWLTIVDYIRKFLFSTKSYWEPTDNYLYGIITGSLLEGTLVIPQLELLYYTSTLAIIGLSGFIVPTLMILLSRKGGIEKVRRIKIIFGTLAAIILITTPFLSILLDPIVVDLFVSGNDLLGFLLALLVSPYFPIFPILAYALLGGIIGISLARDEKKRNITITWLVIGFALLSIGNYILISALTRFSFYNYNFVRFMQLGVYIMIIIILIRVIDLKPLEKQEKIAKKFKPVIMFGRASLTIFVFEAFLATIFHVILNLIIPGWNAEPFVVLLFGIFNLAIWWVILHFWQKKDFKGSIEWMGGYVVRKLSGFGRKEEDNK